MRKKTYTKNNKRGKKSGNEGYMLFARGKYNALENQMEDSFDFTLKKKEQKGRKSAGNDFQLSLFRNP